MIESAVERGRARRKSQAKRSGESLAALTGAAAFFALSAIALAATVVLMPTPWPR